ncbi:MAG: site-specific DNA-methyltransferase [Deltaproteobacteria bacterium]|jgi:site-specific DNA-methyltransferase (adenine-specific)|nr:site-specific DNA-methyltransferase [Deltaproteobacteria bacterium]
MTLYNDDALRVLPALEMGSVDAVITDPPYCAGGASPISRGVAAAHKIQDADSRTKYPLPAGMSRDQRGQLAWMTLWLAECWRISKENGVLLLFSDWRQVPLFTDALQAGGWCWRSTVVWDKTIAARPNKGYFRHQAEFVLFATKDAWKPPTPVCLPGVFSVPVNPAEKNHLTGKPVRLITALMEILAPSTLVLDPFMGGGAVPRACVETGRDYIGVEIQPDIYARAVEFVGRAAPLFNVG